MNIVNLLPLLIDPNEKLLRLILGIVWIAVWERRRELDSMVELVVVTLGLGIVLFQECIHPIMFPNRLEFLPLMLNSIYSAAFNLSWTAVIYARILAEKVDNNDYKEIPLEPNG